MGGACTTTDEHLGTATTPEELADWQEACRLIRWDRPETDEAEVHDWLWNAGDWTTRVGAVLAGEEGMP